MVASDAIRWNGVGEELAQLRSLSLGRDCIVLLVCSYLLEHQRIQRGTPQCVRFFVVETLGHLSRSGLHADSVITARLRLISCMVR